MQNVSSIDVVREKKGIRDRINGVRARRENLLKMQMHSTDHSALQEMAKMFEAMTKEATALDPDRRIKS